MSDHELSFSSNTAVDKVARALLLISISSFIGDRCCISRLIGLEVVSLVFHSHISFIISELQHI